MLMLNIYLMLIVSKKYFKHGLERLHRDIITSTEANAD